MSRNHTLKNLRESQIVKKTCLVLAVLMFSQIALPVMALALTSGATQPEFTSFEPIVTTDLVNDFTGDFTYNLPVLNIPGPDGGGYAMSLNYHSGVSSEEEASWVGFGWNINPGVINRQKRGYPDDFKDTPVIRYNKVKPNWTQSTSASLNMEYFSKDKKGENKGEGKERSQGLFSVRFGKSLPSPEPEAAVVARDTVNYDHLFSFSLKKFVRLSNNLGFSIANSLGTNYKGVASLGMSRAGGENVYSASINPLLLLDQFKATKKLKDKAETSLKNTGVYKKYDRITNDILKYTGVNFKKPLTPSTYSLRTYNAPAIPYSINYNAGNSFNFTSSVQFNPVVEIGLQVGLAGNLNTQINIPETRILANGFMYPPSYVKFEPMKGKNYYQLKNRGIPIIEGDFQIEKATTFNKHDKNLGIPYNSADLLMATGNAALGGFRFQHKKSGTNYPSLVTNTQELHNLGTEFAVGGAPSVGLDLGVGLQETTTKRWNKRTSDTYEYEEALPFLQFSSDMGGMLRYSNHDTLQYATIRKSKKLDLESFENQDRIKEEVHGQSSMIRYAVFGTNGQLEETMDHSYSDLRGTEGQVGQIDITNKDGTKTVYGLPVYVKEETELAIGLGADHFDDGTYLAHRRLEYEDPLKNKTVMGQRIPIAYATTYLMTQNTTFDYVDVNQNGPDEVDYGGWTKFDYRKVFGDDDAGWYRYRAPYTGLFYEKGRLFDLKDQTGSMSSGYKEVYYLNYIETKSHIAFFVTNQSKGTVLEAFIEEHCNVDIPNESLNAYLQGSQELRLDGVDAAAIQDSQDPAASDPTARGDHHLEKLERIVLFAKSDFSAPITTTYFDYDYSLCQELPNSKGNTYGEKGKLTLKKVWTEGGGTIKSRIAPYRFKYNYKKAYPEPILRKYPNLLSKNLGDNYYANLARSDENPDYDPMLLDMWGNYRLDGKERFENGQFWLDQRPAESNYDPAAWQLKQVILPSGGEIHVQYEEKNYKYVQEKRAMGMVPLKEHANDLNGYQSGDDDKGNRYYIDLEAINIPGASAQSYAALLRKHFEKEKLYFKVLYAYTGSPALNLVDNQAALKRMDYITGYTTVDAIEVDENDQLYLQLGEPKSNGVGKNDKTLPRWVCYQKLLTAAGNNLHRAPYQWENSDEEISEIAYADHDANGTMDILDRNEKNKVFREIRKTQVVEGTYRLFTDWSSTEFGPPKLRGVKKRDACKELNHSLSYFKLPLLKAKRGGGIRVKRLISYDPGIENGDAMVYGSEYIYESADGESSGVATNEPPIGREENALVGFHERNKQKWLNKLLNGRDSKVFEGPLGESLYPGAAVVHERILIKNIHQGESTTGYVINQYHTVKDFPSIEVKYSELKRKNGTFRKQNFSLPLGLLNFSQQKAWLSQGYLFKMNDMHGKLKSQASYAGKYHEDHFRSNAYTSLSKYNYSSPGDSILTLLFDPEQQSFIEDYLSPGTEEELSIYESSVRDKLWDFSLEIDLSFILPAAVTMGLSPSITFEDKLLNQHVTSKILRQKTYLLSTTSVADGLAQTNQNIAFDRYTGDPVLTMTYDGYEGGNEAIFTANGNSSIHKGRYYQLNFPASWIYSYMSPNNSYEPNENSNQLSASAGSITTYGINPVSSFGSSGHFKEVVAASATTYRPNWFDEEHDPYLQEGFAIEEEHADLLNKQYYPLRSYVYRDAVGAANSDNKQIYDGGLIPTVDIFPWMNGNVEQNLIDNHWFSASKTLAYSPHGYPIAEEDALGIRSIAKFGYNKQLPVLVAQNADYRTVHFIDFEYALSNFPVDNLVEGAAHSGRYALNLSQNPTHAVLEDIPLTNQLKTKGASLKFWLSSKLTDQTNDPDYGKQNEQPALKVIANNAYYHCQKIAQTGAWSLYEAQIKDWNGAPVGALFDLKLDYRFESNNETVLIDDVRFQPLDAVMNCTVYHKDYKVAAQFDDQHFAVFFEYDRLGNLIRKSIETEKGRKVLQEQQYNTPEKPKYYE